MLYLKRLSTALRKVARNERQAGASRGRGRIGRGGSHAVKNDARKPSQQLNINDGADALK